MQNSSHKWLRLIIEVCLLTAGVLFLVHTLALAESYIRVLDKEVVYYCFSSRKNLQHKQSGTNSLALRPPPSNLRSRVPLPEEQTFIQKMDQLHNLRPLAIKAALRMEANRNPEAAFPEGPDSKQLKFNKTDDLPFVSVFNPTEKGWMGPRYLGRFLSKLRHGPSFDSAAPGPDSRRTECHQAPLPIEDIRAQIRHASNNYLKYAQEQPLELVQLKPGADPLAASGKFSYCFPVAPPFSFRDSWGDFRNGGRYHLGVDIIACEGTPVYAITSGVIHQLSVSPEAGITLFLRGQDGKSYGYMHLQGYAEGIVEGKTVQRGDLIAYVGRTGILYSSAHLHLQVYNDHTFDREKLVNPYNFLVQLCNGKGVTDLLDRKFARQIPRMNDLTYETLQVTRTVPHRFPDAPHFLEHYLKPVTKKQ